MAEVAIARAYSLAQGAGADVDPGTRQHQQCQELLTALCKAQRSVLMVQQNTGEDVGLREPVDDSTAKGLVEAAYDEARRMQDLLEPNTEEHSHSCELVIALAKAAKILTALHTSGLLL
eukprot:m51a1_g8170 hypothetical protein (119) ;mRNA; r:104275-104631